MMSLLVLKERFKRIYQEQEAILKPLFKFMLSFFVFFMINQVIGFDSRLKMIPVMLICSFVSALTPSAVLVLIAALFSAGHIFSVSSLLAAIVMLIYLLLYLLFLRFNPEQGYVVILLPLLFLLKVPYIVPILLGLTAAPASVVSAACGVFVYYLFQIIKAAALLPVSTKSEDLLQLYKYVMDHLIGNKEMLLTIVIFSVVIIVTYLVRRLKIDYAFHFAIAAGAVTTILAFLIVDLRLDATEKIVQMIIGTVISGGITFIIQFFRLTLDYTRVENVQFEDDDYYYYVKAVPKINVTTPKVSVKHINIQKEIEDFEIEDYDYSDYNSK